MNIKCINSILGMGTEIKINEVNIYDEELFTKGKVYQTCKPYKPEKEYDFTELYIVDNLGEEYCIGYIENKTKNLRKKDWILCDKVKENFKFI